MLIVAVLQVLLFETFLAGQWRVSPSFLSPSAVGRLYFLGVAVRLVLAVLLPVFGLLFRTPFWWMVALRRRSLVASRQYRFWFVSRGDGCISLGLAVFLLLQVLKMLGWCFRLAGVSLTSLALATDLSGVVRVFVGFLGFVMVFGFLL